MLHDCSTVSNIYSGVDFDDPESGYKEEEKDSHKVRLAAVIDYMSANIA